MGYDGMGILVCFEWVRGHISKDVKLVLGLLFVLFLLLFTAGQGLLEIRCVPTVLLASKMKFCPTAQAKPYGSWCSWARRRFLGDDGRNDELLEFWDISPPSFLIGKLYVNRIIHKISIYRYIHSGKNGCQKEEFPFKYWDYWCLC